MWIGVSWFGGKRFGRVLARHCVVWCRMEMEVWRLVEELVRHVGEIGWSGTEWFGGFLLVLVRQALEGRWFGHP